MAVTKIWKVVKRMDHVISYAKDENKTKIEFNQKYEMLVDDLQNVIDYARNSDKTEKEYFVTGINCDSDSAYEEMQDTKRYYNKKDKILAFHAYQSFAEGEVTPELAHQIGVQLANEMWGDRFQVVVTTHLNTNHIHNHIVLNSVSFEDGLKYYDNHTNYAKMRHISDELCKEYGLSVIEEKATKKKMNYDNFYKKSLYTDNYSNNAKRDLDLAIRQAYSYDDFLYLMKKLDYEIIFRANKISIRKEPYKRNIRIERRYGENYSIENIKRRIIEEQAVRVPFIENVYNLVMSEDEIGYIAIHFGSYLEKNIISNTLQKVAIVCSTGLGATNLITIRIRKIIGENVEIDTFSIFLILIDRKSTRLNSSHSQQSRMPSSA